jgi:hypothetical protein
MTIPKKYEERVSEMYQDSDGFWIYLKRGWRQGDNVCHTLHEDTQTRLLQELRKTKRCDCDYCKEVADETD